MKITIKDLRKIKMDGCQANLFKETFPKGMEWNGENLTIAYKVGFNIMWLLCSIDLEPSESTRRAACEDSHLAYSYAKFIDKCPRDDTRSASCGDSYFARLYGIFIDKHPRTETRKASFLDSVQGEAYLEWEESIRIERDYFS